MPRRSAQLPSISAKVRGATNAQNRAEIELGEIEREIKENRDRPLSIVLKGVIDRVRSLTDADGAAIALRDAWGVGCRASTGEAPDVGSRLHPESSLTRECFERGQLMICEDTEEDSRVRLAAKSLRLRSAVVVPVQAQGSVLGWWRYSPLEPPRSTRRTLRHCSVSPAYSFRCSSPRNQRTSKSEWEKDAPGPPLPERPFFWLCSCCCLSFTTGQRRRTLPLPIRPLQVRRNPPRRRQYRRELPKP